MNIKLKLIIIFLSISIIPIFILEFLTISSVERLNSNQLIEELQLETDLRKAFLDEIFLDLELKLLELRENDTVIQNILTVKDEFSSRDSEEYLLAKNTLDSFLIPWLNTTPGSIDLLLTDIEGKIIYSANPVREQDELDTFLSDIHKHEILDARGGVGSVNFSNITKDTIEEDVFEMIIDAEIFDDLGEVIGIIAFEIDVEFLYEVIFSVNQLGETGESYLVDSNFTMISPSLFLEDVILKQKVETVGVKHCFSSEKTKTPLLSAYSDYRGVPVLGAYDLIPRTNWCLLSEIDEAEALGPVKLLERNILIFGIIATILITLLAFFFARSISGPIIKLTAIASDISKGKFDTDIDKKTLSSKDEIGNLARAFERTVISLKLAMSAQGEHKKSHGEEPEEKKSETETEGNNTPT